MKIFTNNYSNLGKWIDEAINSSFEDADIVLIPGGSDVDPALYGHKKLPTTYVNEQADAREMGLINDAIKAGKFIIGICKGAQMLTAKAGGWLVQDVSGHGQMHSIETFDGQTFKVNSSHHQMCYPYDLPDADYRLLGWAEEVSRRYIGQENKEIANWDPRYFTENDETKEPEVIFYPKIRGLGVQSHPEWGSMPKEFTAWLNQQIPTLM